MQRETHVYVTLSGFHPLSIPYCGILGGLRALSNFKNICVPIVKFKSKFKKNQQHFGHHSKIPLEIQVLYPLSSSEKENRPHTDKFHNSQFFAMVQRSAAGCLTHGCLDVIAYVSNGEM